MGQGDMECRHGHNKFPSSILKTFLGGVWPGHWSAPHFRSAAAAASRRFFHQRPCLLPPTPCSSALWQRLVDGMRLLFSGLTGKAWIPISVPRWLSLTIPFDWRALCRRPTGFPSAYQPATFTKPLACLTRHKSSITRTNAS